MSEQGRPSETSSASRLPATMRLGAVSLVVADRERTLDFYLGTLGMTLLEEKEGHLWIGTDGGDPILHLAVRPGAAPKPARATGLYHYAILVPTRADLAAVLRRLVDQRAPMQGVADHWVSEAIYFPDPDGNGIEVYADRPGRAFPPLEDRSRMTTEPLDVSDLFSELEPDWEWSGLAGGSRIGHVHLHVSDLAAAEGFYQQALGFDLMLNYGRMAAFLSVGGYHHHLGLNTWAGVGAPPPPEGSAGLRYFTILLPDSADLELAVERLEAASVQWRRHDQAILLKDPSSNGIMLALQSQAFEVHKLAATLA